MRHDIYTASSSIFSAFFFFLLIAASSSLHDMFLILSLHSTDYWPVFAIIYDAFAIFVRY